ncbi:MAG TPA: 7TM diverse intracellular signaling domain-containing protein [Cytophagaceae bacterium]
MIVFYLAGSASIAKPIFIKDGQDDYKLNDYLNIFVDTEKKYSIEDVSTPSFQHNFIENTQPYRYAEHPDYAYWIKIDVVNNTTKRKNWVLEVLSLHTQDLEVYLPENNGFKKYKTGQNYTFDSRDYLVKNFAFDIYPEKGTTYPIFIRVNSNNGASFEYKIRSQQYFSFYSTKEYLFLGIYYGILFFLIVYNLFLSVVTKNKSYLYYIIYLAMCVLLTFEADGLGFEFVWPNLPGLNYHMTIYIASSLFLISFLAYAINFLDLKRYYPQQVKWLYGITIVYFFIAFVIRLPELISTFYYLVPFAHIYFLAIKGFRKGNKAYRYFIVGQSFLLVSLFVTRCSWYGLLPPNILIVYSFNLSILIEGIVFTYAFVDKYNITKREEELAKQELIQQLEENKALQTKVNRELEQKVAERTRQLQEESTKLVEANQKLEQLMAELNTLNSKLDYDNWYLNKQISEEKKARILSEEVSFEEFSKIFPNENACLKFLENLKWNNGYTCKKCNNNKFIPQNKLLGRRCTRCSYIESATTGTLFHAIKFPLDKAFYLLYYYSLKKQSLTLEELAELTGLSKNTCWNFRKRINERSAKREKINKDVNEWEALILD